MGGFFETAWGALAALGLAALFWCLLGRLLRPVPTPRVSIAVPGQGDGGCLEQTVRWLHWLRGMGLLRGTVVIDTTALTEKGRALAVKLAEKYPAVELREERYS